jgi:hypothetical protein
MRGLEGEPDEESDGETSTVKGEPMPIPSLLLGYNLARLQNRDSGKARKKFISCDTLRIG